MCNATSVKFCTCLDAENISTVELLKRQQAHYKELLEMDESEKVYTWELHAYLGTNEFAMDGIFLFPVDQLDGFITQDFVIDALNNVQSFDFPYDPQEGDHFTLRQLKKEGRTDYLSFIYRQDTWIAEGYDPFLHTTELKNFGTASFYH